LCFFSLLLVPVFVMAHPPLLGIGRDLLRPSFPAGARLSDVMLLVIAIVGTTIAPWQLFFQQSYVIDKRITPHFMAYGKADLLIGIGVVLVGAIAMMACTAAAFHGTVGFGQFSDAGALCHFHGIEPCAVAPSAPAHILGGRILGVADEDVGALGNAHNPLIDGRDARFVIAGVHDGVAGAIEPVARSALRVVERERRDADRSHLEWLEHLVELAHGGQVLERDGKQGRGHLPFEDLERLGNRSGRVNVEVVARAVERCEEGNALDVIPVEMGQQQRQRKSFGGADFEAQTANARASVDDQNPLAGDTHFEARRIAAVAQIRRSGRRQRAAHTAEPEGHAG